MQVICDQEGTTIAADNQLYALSMLSENKIVMNHVIVSDVVLIQYKKP